MFCWLSATDGMDAFAELGATVQGAQSNIGTKKTFFFLLYEQLCQGLESNLKCFD